MSFLISFAYPPRHPSFTPVTPSDRQELARAATETGVHMGGDLEEAQLELERQLQQNNANNAFNHSFPSAADELPPIQSPPTFKRNARKLLLYKALLVTVNLSVILGLFLFNNYHERFRQKGQGQAIIFGWFPKQSLLIPVSLLLASIETVLIVGILRESPLLIKLNVLKCAAHSLAALYLLTTVEHFVERTWPLCCDLLLYPLAGHVSLLYVLELNRLRRGAHAWKGYIQAHLVRRRQVMQLDMEMAEQRLRRERMLFDEVSL